MEAVWFPGAHVDVGGGYGDNDLPNFSSKWIMYRLKEKFQFVSKPTFFIENLKGLAHWSYGDEPGLGGAIGEAAEKTNIAILP